MKKMLLLVGALVLGLVIGAVGMGYVLIPLHDVRTSEIVDVTPGQSGRNDAGQTYGPLTDLSFATGPELFEAGATNGRIGYVETSAFAAIMAAPSSLKEALESKPSERVLPVYAVDGKTVIGEYLISAGESGESDK